MRKNFTNKAAGPFHIIKSVSLVVMLRIEKDVASYIINLARAGETRVEELQILTELH